MPSDRVSEYQMIPNVHKNIREVQHPDLIPYKALVHHIFNHEDPRHREEPSTITSNNLDPFRLLQQSYNLQLKGLCLCNTELKYKSNVKESHDCETSYRQFVQNSQDIFVCDV